MNSKLTKEDLSQMDRQYFQTLENENLVEVACNLRNFAAGLLFIAQTISMARKGIGCGSFVII
ncbi:MAG: hypothetical protein GY710_09325 [Desulfobacteraceae bacterium]|nr:hypothetical protein [Desulfobacteraceae bacterium]